MALSRRAFLTLPALALTIGRRRRRVAMYPDDTLGLFFSVVVAGGGLFVYSGAPAAGNLIASVAAAAGTDAYGNTYQGGITDYSPGSVYSQMVNGGVNFGSLAALTRVTVPGQIILADAGGPTIAPVLQVKSPQTAENTVAQILLAGTSQDNTTTPASVTVQPVGPGIVASPFVSILNSLGISVGLATGQLLTVTNTTSAPTQPNVELICNAAADRALGVKVAGDTNNRFLITAGNPSGAIFEGPGNAGADVSYGRISANRFGVVSADLAIHTLGKGLQVARGTNGKEDTAVLVGGTVTVANTSVTANSNIYLGQNTPGGTPGALFVSAKTAGTGFTITSTSATDTSTVAYLITEPG